MNVNYQRAMILQQQGRFSDAEKELRQALAANPQDAYAHAILSLCLAEQKRLTEATQEAQWAIGLSPDQSIGHYALAKSMLERNRFAEAEQSIRQAIDLDPYEADHFALLSAIRISTKQWRAALEAADQGLAIQPEHPWCTNLRAMALVQLGRRSEAGATLGDALSRDPQNSFTHTNQGWSCLHRGEHRPALEHFTEALRLDPTNDYARAGLVEALKARNIVYRWLLMYFLWMSRLQGGAQAGIIIGGWIGYQFIRGLARTNPELAPFLTPLIIAYLVFAYLTWLADPLFNLTLRLSKYGRRALSDDQRRGANLFGLILLAALVALIGAALVRDQDWLHAAGLIALISLSASLIYRSHQGWPRWTLAGVTAATAACVAGAVLADAGLVPARLGKVALGGFILLLLFTVFGAQFIVRIRPKQ